MATVVVALASPLDTLAHERFAAHMLQHMLLTMVAVPLLLLADPLPALLWALPRVLRRRIGRALARGATLRLTWASLTAPIVAWPAHVVTLWLWHLPILYDAALADGALHVLQHVSFFATALLFWWPLIAPAPRLGRPAGFGLRIVYAVVAGFQTAALGLLLAAGARPLYAVHAGAADALADQSLGGVVMLSVGGAVDMLAVLTLLWRFLGAQEGRAEIDRPPVVRENEVI